VITVEGKKREIITDEVFLYFYSLKEWQLDKMKEFAKDRGYFNYKQYKYYTDESKIKQIESKIFISLPKVEACDYHRRVKFLITEKHGNPLQLKKNSFTIIVKIYNTEYPLQEFCEGVGMEDNYFRKQISSYRYARLNGVNIEIIRQPKACRTYTIKSNGSVLLDGQNKKQVVEYTGITIHLLMHYYSFAK
jgi:hypothetical protein